MSLYNFFTESFKTVAFSDKAIEEYGNIRTQLESCGNTISANDLIIASTVKANEGILVTHNVKEFERIKGLKVEDWTE